MLSQAEGTLRSCRCARTGSPYVQIGPRNVRYRGEEFIVVLPRTPKPLACIVAERLRSVIELAGLPALRTTDSSLEGLQATISCGVATAAPRFYPDPLTLIGAADEALYRAKQDGRNLVRGCDEGVILQSVLNQWGE